MKITFNSLTRHPKTTQDEFTQATLIKDVRFAEYLFHLKCYPESYVDFFTIS